MGNPRAIVPISVDNLIPVWQDAAIQNTLEGRDSAALGVFSSFPTATEKWSRHRPRNMDYADTMARMFIRVPPGDYKKFLDGLDDPDTRTIAQFLTGDDAGKGGVGYLDFLLHSAVHQFSEKVQVCETLSDNYVAFFFGHQAPIFTYQGTLYNTYQDDWTMRMLRIFRDLGRGTQLARRGLIMYMKYDSIIVQGAMVDFRYVLQAGREMATSFDFSLLVKRVSIIYGAQSTPTHPGGTRFAPEGFHTEDTGQNDVYATNTYVAPSTAAPEGVSGWSSAEAIDTNEWDPGGSGLPTTWDTGEYATPPPPAPGDTSVPKPAVKPQDSVNTAKAQQQLNTYTSLGAM